MWFKPQFCAFCKYFSQRKAAVASRKVQWRGHTSCVRIPSPPVRKIHNFCTWFQSYLGLHVKKNRHPESKKNNLTHLLSQIPGYATGKATFWLRSIRVFCMLSSRCRGIHKVQWRHWRHCHYTPPLLEVYLVRTKTELKCGNRPRSHNKTLITKSTQLNDRDFLIRSIYKYSYWL